AHSDCEGGAPSSQGDGVARLAAVAGVASGCRAPAPSPASRVAAVPWASPAAGAGAVWSSGRITRAGLPTAVAPAGTGLITTALEPIRAWAPTVKPPRIWAPAPTTTPSSSVGWRFSPLYRRVPPRVTPW